MQQKIQDIFFLWPFFSNEQMIRENIIMSTSLQIWKIELTLYVSQHFLRNLYVSWLLFHYTLKSLEYWHLHYKKFALGFSNQNEKYFNCQVF